MATLTIRVSEEQRVAYRLAAAPGSFESWARGVLDRAVEQGGEVLTPQDGAVSAPRPVEPPVRLEPPPAARKCEYVPFTKERQAGK